MECPNCKSNVTDENQPCPSCGYRFTEYANQPADPLDILVTARHLVPGTLIANRYQIIELLGRGGMGIVFKARDKELDIEVAIKFLPQELSHDERAVKDLKKEAKAAMLLSHPNIVRLHNFESIEGLNFVIMEYINGPNLSRLLSKKESFTSTETLRFAKDICKGLGYAHQNHVIHRDIKPQNLMLHYLRKPGDVKSDIDIEYMDLSGDWLLKIADFGIARIVSDTMSRVSQRPTTGTLVYMSPEQLQGKEVDNRTDIYSFGCVLYELSTGKPPFYTGDIYHQHLEKPPVPPKERNSAVSENLNNFILNCLAKDPDGRYQTIEELGKDLERVSANQSVEIRRIRPSAPHKSVPTTPVMYKLPQPLAWIGLIVIVAGLVTSFLVYQNRHKTKGMPSHKSQPQVETVSTKKSRQAQEERKANYTKWYDKGIEELIDKNYDGAIAAFQRALEYEENESAREKLKDANYEKYYAQGQTVEKQGDNEKAIELYQKALEYKRVSETEKKITSIQDKIEHEKKQKEARERYDTWYSKGEEYEKIREWEKAKKAYEEALVSLPSDKKAKERIDFCEEKLNPDKPVIAPVEKSGIIQKTHTVRIEGVGSIYPPQGVSIEHKISISIDRGPPIQGGCEVNITEGNHHIEVIIYIRDFNHNGKIVWDGPIKSNIKIEIVSYLIKSYAYLVIDGERVAYDKF